MKVKINGIAHNLYIWLERQSRRLNQVPDLPANVYYRVNYELLDFLSEKQYIKLTPAEFEKDIRLNRLWLNRDAGYFFRYEYTLPSTQINFYKTLDYHSITKLANNIVYNIVCRERMFDYFNRPKMYVEEIYYKSYGDRSVLGVLFHETKGYPPMHKQQSVMVNLKDEVF